MVTEDIKYIVNRLKIPGYFNFPWTLEVDGLEAIPSMLPSLLVVNTPTGTYFVKKDWCRKVKKNKKVVALQGRLH